MRASLLFLFGVTLSAQWVNAPKAGVELPAGVTHKTYRSAAMKCDVGYLVYLPPDYDSSGGRRYPVVYNLHGAGGNEWHGMEEARLLEMGIRSGKWPAMKYPEMFISLFNQAGNVMHSSTDPLTGYMGPDRARYIDNDSYLLLKKNLARIKDQLRIQVWCGTKDDGHLGTVRQYHQALLESGVDHTYLEIEGLAHARAEMVKRYEGIWFDYHVESFRRAGALPR